MVFSYYKKLSAANKCVYRASDSISLVEVPAITDLQPLIPALAHALEQKDRLAVESLCRKLLEELAERLGVPPLRVRVLAVRPWASWGELHGLYQPGEGQARAAISLWMRTAKQRRVVAFKTFLRTLLHELCHHLDYELFRLPDSFHTEGFYKRESSLFISSCPNTEKRKPISKG